MIYQALFGDKDNAYSTLETNHPDLSLITRLCLQTDLLSRPASNTPLPSSVRGFSIGAEYLVMKTYPDTSPGVRHGRVYTHAFILDQSSIASVDLHSLFTLLPKTLDKSVRISPTLNLTLADNNTYKDSNSISKVWRGFLENKIVVWGDEANFEQTVTHLWLNMPTEMRNDFEFELCFSSSQLNVKGKYTLLNSPNALPSKWDTNKFLLVNQLEQSFTPTELELFLSGDKNSETFKNFLKSSQQSISDFEKLKALQAVYKAYSDLVNCDFNRVNTAFRLVQKYFKNEPKSRLSEAFFSKMVIEIPKGNVQVINGIRKTEVHKSIQDFETRIRTAVAEWCEKYLFDRATNNSDAVYSLVSSVQDRESQPWWKESINTQLTRENKTWGSENSKILWLWLKSKDYVEVYQTIRPLLTENSLTELETAKTVEKNLPPMVLSHLIEKTQVDGLYSLFVSLSLLTQDDKAVMNGLLLVDKVESNTTAIDFLHSSIGDDRFFMSSMNQTSDQRIASHCSAILLGNRKYIKELTFDKEFHQQIIYKFLISAKDIYYENYKAELIYPLLESLIKGNSFDVTFSILGLYRELELVDYSGRKQVWSYLKRNNFIVYNTAKKLIVNLNEEMRGDIEIELRSAMILPAQIGIYLNTYSRDMRRALIFFELFPEIKEQVLQDFIYYFDVEINTIDSKRLGDLVAARRWATCAGIIFSKTKRYQSFGIALDCCSDMLSVWDKLAASFFGYSHHGRINENDFWKSLHEITCRLYPEGPKQNKLWKNAGGDNSEIINNGPPKNIWLDTLHRLRHGELDGVEVKSLLNAMLNDYKKNEDLKFLKKIMKEIWPE